MRQRLPLVLILSTALITTIALAWQAQARGGWGCFVCVNDGFMDDHCEQVGDNQHGDGIQCDEVPNGISHNCVIPPDPCFNVISGGGGSTGGGGSSGCTYQGGYCPASCSSCTWGSGTGNWLY